MGGGGCGGRKQYSNFSDVKCIFGLSAVGRLAVCQIVAIVLVFFSVCVCCPGRGLLLSGKRQMVSMDGSLLNWLAALLIPLHATLT